MNPFRSVLQALNAVAFQSGRERHARTFFFFFFSAQVDAGVFWRLVNPGGDRSVARSNDDVAAAAIYPQYVFVYLLFLFLEGGRGRRDAPSLPLLSPIVASPLSLLLSCRWLPAADAMW